MQNNSHIQQKNSFYFNKAASNIGQILAFFVHQREEATQSLVPQGGTKVSCSVRSPKILFIIQFMQISKKKKSIGFFFFRVHWVVVMVKTQVKRNQLDGVKGIAFPKGPLLQHHQRANWDPASTWHSRFWLILTSKECMVEFCQAGCILWYPLWVEIKMLLETYFQSSSKDIYQDLWWLDKRLISYGHCCLSPAFLQR